MIGFPARGNNVLAYNAEIYTWKGGSFHTMLSRNMIYNASQLNVGFNSHLDLMENLVLPPGFGVDIVELLHITPKKGSL